MNPKQKRESPVGSKEIVGLLPCICGGTPKFDGYKGKKWVVCPKCGRMTEYLYTWGGARQRWNHIMRKQPNTVIKPH